VGLSYRVQVNATVAVFLGCRRPGRQLLQPVVEKRPAIRSPRRAAEQRTVNRIGQQCAGHHVENPHDAVLRAGRRGAIGDVAAIPRGGVVVERPVRAACVLQPLGIDEQVLGGAEAVAHIELVDLFPGEPLEIEQAGRTNIGRAERRIGIREPGDPLRQGDGAGKRGEGKGGAAGIDREAPGEGKRAAGKAPAAGPPPPTTSRFATRSTRKFSPSSVRATSNVRSPGSPKTTSSPVRFPATVITTIPVQRSSTVPFAWRNRHWLLRSTPNASSTSAGTQLNSAPVSTRTDPSVRLWPGLAGFSI